MRNDPEKRCRELEKTIQVLESENELLSERAEETLLISLISESIRSIDDKDLLLETVLEKICILKNIPYCAWAELKEPSAVQHKVHAAFTDINYSGTRITLPPKTLNTLDTAPLSITHGFDPEKEFGIDFNGTGFNPVSAIFFPFSAQLSPRGLFFFMDDDPDENKLTAISMLLRNIIDMVEEKLDKIALVKALKQLNTQLDQRIKLRTKSLIKTNHQLTQKIIDHKRSQAALSESEKRFHTLFDEAPDAIFLIQMDDRILDANLAAATMLGYTREELQTMTVVDIQAPEVRGTAGETMKNELTLGKTFQGLDVHRDGTLIPVEIHNNKMVINDDEIVLSIVRDITERKKFESRLRQSQKMEAIGTLAGGIAHDFNNILSGIFGYSELAVANIHDPEQAKRYISQIIHNSKRAADLVRQILTFSRQSRYKKHPVSIHTVVTEALQLLRSLIPANIEIEKRLDSQAIVLADSTKIHQLIINLCTNAYHAIGKAGGKITLSLTRKIISESTPIQNDTISAGTYLALEIRDTGTGMDEKTMKKAFDPYFTTKAVGKGTGLGLALVQAIVKEHDGFMDVHSQPEKGSCFCIFLPVFEEKPPGHALPDDLPAPVNGNERIMVVDDEQAIREVTGEFLSNYGYTVDLFKNGEDALEEFKRDPDKYDLIVTDMAMPRMTGDKLAVELIKKNPGLPIFLCTGFSENMSRETAASLGISRLIIKPLELKCLARDIRQVLDTISRDQNRT